MSCTREPWEGPVGLTCASSENSSSKRVGRRRLVSIWRWDVSSLFGKSGQNELHEGTVGGPDEQSGAGKGERVKLLWESVSMTGQGESARSAVG